MISKPEKLDALTSLRFFAAAMIVLIHIDPVFGSWGLASALPLDQGVSFFFVLSGFILAYNYPNLAGETDVLTFLKARIARIYPSHLAAIAVLVLLTAHLNVGRHLPTASFAAVANLFLFQSLVPIRKVFFAFNPVAWSISTELFFYFAFPFLVIKKHWLFKLMLLSAIVLLYLWFVAAWQIPYDRMDLTSASVEGLIYINPFVRVLEFFSGILAYFAFSYWKPKINYSVGLFSVLEILAVLLAVLVMYYSIHLPITEHNDFTRVFAFYLHKSGSFWLFALLIIIFAFSKGWLSKLLSFKPMVLLGEISFALYLLHRTVLEWYEIHAVYFEALPDWFLVICYWLLALTLAFLLHKTIENPCRKLIMALPVNFKAAAKILFTVPQTLYLLALVMILGLMKNIVYLPLNPCSPVSCNSLAKQSLAYPAVFADTIELTAIQIQPLNAEQLTVDLLFTVRQPISQGYGVAIDLIDKQQTLAKTDTQIFKALGLIQGQQWVERIKLPSSWQGKRLGIAIHNKAAQRLILKHPDTDDGQRLVIN